MGKKENKIKYNIVDYMLLEIFNNSVSGNYIIDFEEIEEHFNIKLNDTLIHDIELLLLRQHVISDVEIYSSQFDIIVYSNYLNNL